MNSKRLAKELQKMGYTLKRTSDIEAKENGAIPR